MKQLLVSIIIALVVLSNALYAEENTHKSESEITLELVCKEPFDEIVEPEGFPSPEIKQILEENDIPQEDKDWLLSSLRIEIAKRKRMLYTNDGKAVQLPDDLKSIITSDNLKYMIVYASHYDYGGYTGTEVERMRDEWLDAYKKFDQWRAKYEKANENNKQEFKDSMYYWLKIRDDLERRLSNIQANTKHMKTVICLEAATGKVLWEKEGWVNTFSGKGEYIYPPSFISNDGKTTVTVPALGPANQFYRSIYFDDENGNERKAVTGLYGSSRCHDLASDGEMFCTLIEIIRDDTKVGAVAAYDKDGNELWITEIPGYRPSLPPSIAISPNHKYIAASIWGTNLLNEKGDIINTYECRTYKPGFSADEKYLMLGYPRDTIYFVQTDNGDVLWKKSLGGQPYSKPFIANDGRAIFYTDGYLLDKNGTMIWRDTGELKGTVGLSPSGHFFIPSSDPELIIYRIYSDVLDEDQ